MPTNPAKIKESAIESRETPALFDNPNVRFANDSLELLRDLSSNLEQIMSLSEDKLKAQSLTFRRLGLIKGSTEAMIAGIKQGRFSVRNLISALEAQIRFIQRYNEDLANLIKNYSGEGKSEDDTLVQEIKGLSADASRLLNNIDIILGKIDALKNKDLKYGIKGRVGIAHRINEELKALTADLEDINNWSRHFNNGIGFFARRIKIYFEGGTAEDKVEFISLDKLGDKPLKIAVFGSREVRAVYEYAKNVETQIRFILGLIAFLKRDLDASGRDWVRNESTRVFFKNVDEYIKKFTAYYSNPEFAQKLIGKKSEIGERPFGWIQMLQDEMENIRSGAPNANAILENARVFLDATFKTRIERLKQSLNLVISSLSRILVSMEDFALVKEIEKGIIKLEAQIKSKWKDRLKRLKKINGKLRSHVVVAYQQLNKFIDAIDVSQAANTLARTYSNMLAYGDHGDKIAKNTNPLNQYHFPYMASLVFVFARINDAIDFVINELEEVKSKDAISRVYKIDGLKKSINLLLELYLKAIAIISLLELEINMQRIVYMKGRITRFRGDYYG